MEKENDQKTNLVQTYADDMVKVLQDDRGGTIRQIIHGEEKHEEEKRNLSPESRKNRLLVFVSLLLVLASIGTLSFFYFTKKEIITVDVPRQFVPLIFNDAVSLIEVSNLKKEEIAKRFFEKLSSTTVKDGGVEGIYLTINKRLIGLRKFLSLIEANLVIGNNTVVVDDNFLIGVVKNAPKKADAASADRVSPEALAVAQGSDVPKEEKPDDEEEIILSEPDVSSLYFEEAEDEATLLEAIQPEELGEIEQISAPSPVFGRGFFMLIKMRSVADIFTTMHAWENKMFSDLHSFIGVGLSPETKFLLTKNFEDSIIENKNARVLYDQNNNIVLMYIFANENSVVITDNEKAAREVIRRLASGRLSK